MNQKSQQLKEEAIKAMEDYRESIMEEVSKLIEEWLEQLKILYNTGIDKKLGIRLADVDVEEKEAEEYRVICLNRRLLSYIVMSVTDMQIGDTIEEFWAFYNKLSCVDVVLQVTVNRIYGDIMLDIKELICKINNVVDIAISAFKRL